MVCDNAGKERIVTQKEYYDFREEENTRQVSILALVRGALKKWKIILLAGLVVGCLFGGYKIVSIRSHKQAMIDDYDTYKAKSDAYKKSIEEYKSTIADLQKRIDARIAYASNSIKMRLDPYNVPMASADIGISSDEKMSAEDNTAIRTAIYNEILFGDSLNDIAAKHNIGLADLRDLITVKLATTGGTVRLTVRAEDEETAVAVREDILTAVEKKHKDIAKALGEYKFSAFNKGVMTAFDTELLTYQEKQQTSLSTLQTSAYTAQNQSTQLTKPVSVPQYSKKYMLINGIKMGIVGFVGGAILAMIALIALMIHKGCIFNKDEIDGEYGLRNLADFSSKGPEKDSGALEYILARLENHLGDQKAYEIVMVGQAAAKKAESLAKALNKKAKDEGITMHFSFLPDMMKSAGTLRELRKSDGVILAEEIGGSDYVTAREEIAVIADSGRELLGTVYF